MKTSHRKIVVASVTLGLSSLGGWFFLSQRGETPRRGGGTYSGQMADAMPSSHQPDRSLALSHVPDEIQEGSRVVPSSLPGGGGYWETGQTFLSSWRDVDNEQAFRLTNFNLVEIRDSKISPQSGEWESLVHYRNANFAIMRIDVGFKDQLVVGGWNRAGGLVIQRWDLLSQAVPGGPPPLLPPKGFQVTDVYTGPLTDELYAVGIDYEGRYVLALLQLAGGTSLCRFDSAANSTPTVILDEVAEPSMQDMYYMSIIHHDQLGRVAVLIGLDNGTSDGPEVWLIDDDNDGVFDGQPLVGNHSEFVSWGLYALEDLHGLNGPWN